MIWRTINSESEKILSSAILFASHKESSWVSSSSIPKKINSPAFISEKILDLLTNNLPIHGIDVNSKFENEDTLKDIGKLKEFNKILRL